MSQIHAFPTREENRSINELDLAERTKQTSKPLTPASFDPFFCGCPITGDAQGQVGWGTGKPDLASGNTVDSREGGTKQSLWSLPTNTILRLSDSMVL